jgi:hypothetical protein
MRDFRAKRLNDLKLLSIRPTYGDVKDLTTDNYIDEVDKEDYRTVVVIHIYDPIIQVRDQPSPIYILNIFHFN